MTKSEYQELVEFLGKKFTRMDRRFDAMEGRLDAIEGWLDAIEGRLDAIEGRLDAIEERLTRVEVLGQADRHQIRIVAEGVGALRETMTREFKAVRSEMAEGFGAVWSELRSVRSDMVAGFDAQGRLIRGLGSRVGHLEA